MKRSRYLLIAIAVACVLSLTACAKTPEQATESKEDTTVSQPSEVTPSDTKIQVPPVSQSEEDVSLLTLEQVKTVIKESEGQADSFRWIHNKLLKIQKQPISQNQYGRSIRIFRLFDEVGSLNDTIEMDIDSNAVLYQKRDTNGDLMSEETLYNPTVGFDTGSLTIDKVQEIIHSAEANAEELKKNHLPQSKYIYEELKKTQDGGFYKSMDQYSDSPLGFLFILPSDSLERMNFIFLRHPKIGSVATDDMFEGDTLLYLLETDSRYHILHQELLYEAKYEPDRRTLP